MQDKPKQTKKRKSASRFNFGSKDNTRKEQVKHIFGAYKDEVPDKILEYIIRNPRRVLNRFHKVYGDKAILYMLKDDV